MKLRALLVGILSCAALAQSYAPGDRVIFDHIGELKEGEIVSFDGRGYIIRWPGQWGMNERYFTPEYIKRRAGQPAQPAAQPPAQPQQQAQWQPGDQVIFDHIGELKQGEIAGFDGKSYLIRWPGPYGMNERYFTPDHIKGRPGQAQPQPQAQTQPQPANTPGGGGGVMSQQDVLNFLRGRLGNNPFGPHRDQALKEYAEEVKRRGVNFRLDANSPFYQELGKMGAGSEITFPIKDNFGPPNTRAALFGTWKTEVNAPAVYFEQGGYEWRRNAQVQAVGSIRIDPGGTYSWTTGGKAYQGTWRPATPTEMKYAGGEGLVLSKGRGGWDWIVTKYRDPVPPNKPPNWIRIAELGTRQEQEFGNR